MTQPLNDAPTYVGKCATCGLLVFAGVDRPDMARENAKEIANLIRDGHTVERTTAVWVREHSKWCRCNDKPAQPELLEAAVTP